ncbi:hypothetical protein ACLOJK_032232 [Asimina triloba]
MDSTRRQRHACRDTEGEGGSSFEIMATSYTGIHADRAEDPSGMTVPCNASNQNTTTPSSSEDSTKKIRKPYTITKSRESWTEQEHDKFLEAVQLFDRDWKKIESYIGSKTVTQECPLQIRSHAQKYFMKVQKNGTNGHVPPPRPKRKAIHPYPHKAPENGQNLEFLGSYYSENLLPAIPSHGTLPSQSSSSLLEPGYDFRTNSLSINSTPIAHVSSPVLSSLPPANASHMMADNSSSGNPCGGWQTNEIYDQVNHGLPVRDFAQVFAFVGSIFDPNTSGHLERLMEMNPADANAVCLASNEDHFVIPNASK